MAVHAIPPSYAFGSNVFVIVGDRTAVVDAGSEGNSSYTVNKVREALGGRSLDMLILTHAHYDHIGGVPAIVDEFGCTVYAGKDARAIADADSSVTLCDDFDGTPVQVEVEELADGDVIDLGGHRLRVMDTPGHTVGEICLYDEKSSDLFSGDVVFKTGVGRTDLPTGSSADMAWSLRRLANIQINILYPGHGSCCTDGNASVRHAMRIMGMEQ
ncbi:MAG: MBL fold metallo-hydrolase [Candidatus Methanoplasma sp.]|nr:MBL fold metallo-hydrolase [Candidatus Methanoplasma sp.]